MRDWILLRGLVRESAHWMGFESLLQKNFPADHIVCIDLPGSGKYHHLTSPTKVSEYVDFLKEKVSTDQNQKVLIGISFGGMIGIDWVHRHPNFFQKAFIINSSFSNLSPFYRRLKPHNYWSILKLFLCKNTFKQEEAIFQMTVNLRKDKEEILKKWVEIQKSRPVSKKSAYHQFIASSKYRLPGTKPLTPITVLGTWGDQLVHPSCSEEFAKYWCLKKYTHPSAGHDLSLDVPDWVIDCIQQEISRL